MLDRFSDGVHDDGCASRSVSVHSTEVEEPRSSSSFSDSQIRSTGKQIGQQLMNRKIVRKLGKKELKE